MFPVKTQRLTAVTCTCIHRCIYFNTRNRPISFFPLLPLVMTSPLSCTLCKERNNLVLKLLVHLCEGEGVFNHPSVTSKHFSLVPLKFLRDIDLHFVSIPPPPPPPHPTTSFALHGKRSRDRLRKKEIFVIGFYQKSYTQLEMNCLYLRGHFN